MPRISSSVWPGPEVRSDMPGTCSATCETLVMPCAFNCAPDSAVMLSGALCTVEERFSAVTTTSSTPFARGLAGVAAATCVPAACCASAGATRADVPKNAANALKTQPERPAKLRLVMKTSGRKKDYSAAARGPASRPPACRLRRSTARRVISHASAAGASPRSCDRATTIYSRPAPPMQMMVTSMP